MIMKSSRCFQNIQIQHRAPSPPPPPPPPPSPSLHMYILPMVLAVGAPPIVTVDLGEAGVETATQLRKSGRINMTAEVGLRCGFQCKIVASKEIIMGTCCLIFLKSAWCSS